MKTKATKDKDKKEKKLNVASVAISPKNKPKKKIKEQNKKNKAKKKVKRNITSKTKTNVEVVENPEVESNKEETSNIRNEKLSNLKHRQFNRAFRKVIRNHIGDYNNALNIKLNAKEIKAKIEDIKSKQVLSKTSKRKLSILQKKLRTEESTNKPIQRQHDNKKNKEIQKNKNKQTKVKLEKNDQDSNAENKSDKRKGERNQGKVEKQISTKIPKESDESITNKKTKVNSITEIKKEEKIIATKKKLYLLLVENLPSDITVHELKRYFLTKVRTVSSIRIVPQKTNMETFSPRIAYVEVTNIIDFEKGLSLNNALLRKRKIKITSSHDAKVERKSKKKALREKKQDTKKPQKME